MKLGMDLTRSGARGSGNVQREDAACSTQVRDVRTPHPENFLWPRGMPSLQPDTTRDTRSAKTANLDCHGPSPLLWLPGGASTSLLEEGAGGASEPRRCPASKLPEAGAASKPGGARRDAATAAGAFGRGASPLSLPPSKPGGPPRCRWKRREVLQRGLPPLLLCALTALISIPCFIFQQGGPLRRRGPVPGGGNNNNKFKKILKSTPPRPLQARRDAAWSGGAADLGRCASCGFDGSRCGRHRRGLSPARLRRLRLRRPAARCCCCRCRGTQSTGLQTMRLLWRSTASFKHVRCILTETAQMNAGSWLRLCAPRQLVTRTGRRPGGSWHGCIKGFIVYLHTNAQLQSCAPAPCDVSCGTAALTSGGASLPGVGGAACPDTSSGAAAGAAAGGASSSSAGRSVVVTTGCTEHLSTGRRRSPVITPRPPGFVFVDRRTGQPSCQAGDAGPFTGAGRGSLRPVGTIRGGERRG